MRQRKDMPQPKFQINFGTRGLPPARHRTPQLYISDIYFYPTNIFCIFATMDGLIIKNGREINLRKDGETGIARVARIKKELKSAKKIAQIADGINLAEARKSFRDIK